MQTASPPLEFGIVYGGASGEIDVALEAVKAGWAKVREGGGKGGEEEEGSRKALLKAAEEEARVAGKGQWAPAGPPERTVEYSMPEDCNAFLAEHKGKPLDGELFARSLSSGISANDAREQPSSRRPLTAQLFAHASSFRLQSIR